LLSTDACSNKFRSVAGQEGPRFKPPAMDQRYIDIIKNLIRKF